MSIDIPSEIILEAARRVDAKDSICPYLPDTRVLINEDGTFSISTLVCSKKMGGKQTGVAAEHCTNCLKKG